MAAFGAQHEVINDCLSLVRALPHPTGIFHAADGKLLAANAPFCSALALPEEESSEITGPHFLAGQGPACQPAFFARIKDETLAHFVSPSGVRALMDADIRTVVMSGNTCWLIVPSPETWQNASARQRAGNGHYRDLLENLNEIIYINDTQANVLYVSPNIDRISGYSAPEVIGRSFTEFVHPEDLDGRIEMFYKILAGEEQATEYRMLTKNGEIRWAWTNARPLFKDGEVVGMQGALVDITELKEIEAALRRSEEKYRKVIENAKDAIFVTQGNHLKYMNPSASAILGFEFDRIAERPFWDFIHPDDRALIQARYAKRLAGERISDHTAFRIINRQGEPKDVDLNAVLIDWEGQPAVLNFLRDVTLQKKMEAQLRNSQKMEALGTLSGGIAHNFNNLLMGIKGNVSLSLAKLRPSTPVYRHLEKIASLVQSGSKLTHQLLAYARGRACKMETVAVDQLVKDVSDTLAATKRQVQIRFDLNGDTPPIRADQGQIEQVLLNLLLNAADAMPEGGQVLIETACLKGAEACGKVVLSENTDYVMIKVSDWGTGIESEHLERIFEPFFTTKGLGRGTGLGLSTAYGIIKNHEGDIAVETEVGQGSTFYIYLPAHSADLSAPYENSESTDVACQGTILLVDDESEVLFTSTELLRQLGFSVLKAADGAAALKLFQNNCKQIDLVLLDLILPDTSGKELYDRFRKIDAKVKVLISSGYYRDEQAEDLITKGCLGFIQKPYDMAALAETMMEIIAA